MAKVNLLFFGGLKDQVGHAKVTREVRNNVRLCDMITQIELNGPFLCAVNQVQVDPHSELTLYDGDEVAFMPPLSGG